MSLRQLTAWLSKGTLSQMIVEADRAYPEETGGVLLGYWAVPFSELVITGAIGPGPRAVHCKDSFLPDHEYQENQIARGYHASGRLHSYLGDWHTHPNSTAQLSRTDRRTLRTIATETAARSPIPTMAILAGTSPWTLRIWRGIPIRIGSSIITMRTSILSIKVYESKKSGQATFPR
jgi:integrative and conjugative element protein (TIGR02256 family)